MRKMDRIEIGLIVASGVTAIIAILALALAFYNFGRSENQLKRTLLTDCNAQNYRHDKTVSFLRHYVTKYEASHHLTTKQETALRRQVRANLTLIDDLQPHRRCPEDFQ